MYEIRGFRPGPGSGTQPGGPSKIGGTGGPGAIAVEAAVDAGARLGPNAVTQTLSALADVDAPELAGRLARSAGIPTTLPAGLIPEAWFVSLVGELHGELGEDTALRVLEGGGEGTGRYVLEHRIPAVARSALRVLPPRVALPALLAACARHAWTFAGSGRMCWETDEAGAVVTLEGSPTCRGRRLSGPGGSFYAGAFRVLVRALVAPRAVVEERTCVARGDDLCRIGIAIARPERWRPACLVSVH
jgi:divinyl protochlorophyllide a 8-vinyl-reductase